MTNNYIWIDYDDYKNENNYIYYKVYRNLTEKNNEIKKDAKLMEEFSKWYR